MNNLYEAVSVWVKIEDGCELPKPGTTFPVKVKNGFTQWDRFSNQQSDKQFTNELLHSGITHWLRPLPNHVAVSVEKLEALEKCAETLDNILSVDCTSKLKALANIGDMSRQALSNLSTIK